MFETLLIGSAGAGGLLVGLVGGNVQGFFRGFKRGQGKYQPYLCDCGHAYSKHGLTEDSKSLHIGPCQSTAKRAHYAKSGTRNGHEWAQCPCAGYVGVRPSDELS